MVYELNSCTLSPMLPVFFGLLVPVGSRSSWSRYQSWKGRGRQKLRTGWDHVGDGAPGCFESLKKMRWDNFFMAWSCLTAIADLRGNYLLDTIKFRIPAGSRLRHIIRSIPGLRATTAFPCRARLNRSLAPRAGSMGHCLVDIWYGQLCLHDTHELWIFSRQKFSYCLQHPATDASWPLVFAVPEVPLHHVSYGGGSWIQVEGFSGPQT